MRVQFLCLAVALVSLAGCAGERRSRLPELVSTTDGQEKQACMAVFPQGNWQFVHSIEFSMKGGAGSEVLGVTSIGNDQIESALVTVEGLTLFEAAFGNKGRIDVHRAVPPFDGPEFARGLFADIRAIFRRPSGVMTGSRHLPDGNTVCRFSDDDARVVDILPNVNGCWAIETYSPEKLRDRSIVAKDCRQQGGRSIPGYLELTTSGSTGYTLKMTLIRADVLP